MTAVRHGGANRLTLIRCGGYEERQDAIMAAQNAEEEAQHALALDMPDRRAADCDRCREPQSTGLTMSGGQAVCDECIAAELAEDGPEGDVAF